MGGRGGEQPGMKISFMSRLTLGIVVGLILFGVAVTFVTGLTTAVNNIAVFYGVPTAPFPQPWWELLLSFSVGFIPVAIVVWEHRNGEESVSLMERLTLGILVAVILFGVIFTFVTGMTIAVNGIATYYGATAPFPQPFWELLISFAVALIPISIEIWKHQSATLATSEQAAT